MITDKGIQGNGRNKGPLITYGDRGKIALEDSNGSKAQTSLFFT